jgi:hypothetical protein
MELKPDRAQLPRQTLSLASDFLKRTGVTRSNWFPILTLSGMCFSREDTSSRFLAPPFASARTVSGVADAALGIWPHSLPFVNRS